MTMNRQDRVKLFLQLSEENGEDHPLYFMDYVLRDASNLLGISFHNGTLCNKIKTVLLLSERGSTYHKKHSENDRAYQSQQGKRRSSFDIWRMLRGLDVEVTLLEVMEAIYDLGGQVFSNVCSNVGRRVFTRTVNNNGYALGMFDEYGLKFEHWQNISGSDGLKPVLVTMYDPNHVLYRAKYDPEIRGVRADNREFNPLH